MINNDKPESNFPSMLKHRFRFRSDWDDNVPSAWPTLPHFDAPAMIQTWEPESGNDDLALQMTRLTNDANEVEVEEAHEDQLAADFCNAAADRGPCLRPAAFGVDRTFRWRAKLPPP